MANKIASDRLTAIEHGPVEIASVYQEDFSSDRSVKIVLKSSPGRSHHDKTATFHVAGGIWLPRPEKCCQICVLQVNFSKKYVKFVAGTCECIWFLLVMNSCICELCDDYYMCIYPLDPSGMFHIVIMHKFPKGWSSMMSH